MWLFTKQGFTSIVQYKASKDPNKNGGHYKLAMENPHTDYVLVRARIKADLEAIETKSGLDLHIQTDPGADYAHRGLVSKEEWKSYLCMAVDDIDYDSHFKEVTRDNAPNVSGRYSAMMSVWSAFAKLQDLKPYGNYTYSSSGDWDKDSFYLGRGNSSTTASSTVKGDGYPWARTTTTTASYTEELTLSDAYVGVDDMAKLLLEHTPKDVPQAELDNVDDDAFSLWLAADDAVGEQTVILDMAAVDEIAGEIGLEINW